jgi:hypothetical protein
MDWRPGGTEKPATAPNAPERLDDSFGPELDRLQDSASRDRQPRPLRRAPYFEIASHARPRLCKVHRAVGAIRRRRTLRAPSVSDLHEARGRASSEDTSSPARVSRPPPAARFVSTRAAIEPHGDRGARGRVASRRRPYTGPVGDERPRTGAVCSVPDAAVTRPDNRRAGGRGQRTRGPRAPRTPDAPAFATPKDAGVARALRLDRSVLGVPPRSRPSRHAPRGGRRVRRQGGSHGRRSRSRVRSGQSPSVPARAGGGPHRGRTPFSPSKRPSRVRGSFADPRAALRRGRARRPASRASRR